MSAVSRQPLPDGITARTIDVAGGPLAVLDGVPPGTPQATALLVPGYTGSKEDFVFVLEPLMARGFRAVAIDQRGQYESPGPDDPHAYTTASLGRDLLAVAAALGDEPVHLVGHSFGGLVARSAVLQDPTAFRSLTLMGSGPAALSGPRADVLPFMRAILEEGGLQAVWEASESLPPRPGRPPVTDDVRDFLRARLLGGSPAALIAMADSLTTEPDRVAELKATGVPVLVTYGEEDDAWLPDVQDEMAARLEAPVVVVPDAFHSPAAENPALAAQVLCDFFAGT